jgi:hypothetical protein
MSRPGLSKRPATYDDLVKVPKHLVAEILEGDLYATPRPAAPHALAASALGGELFGPFHSGRGGPGGWWILDEPELHLGSDVVVPDLAGWRRSTLPQIPDAPRALRRGSPRAVPVVGARRAGSVVVHSAPASRAWVNPRPVTYPLRSSRVRPVAARRGFSSRAAVRSIETCGLEQVQAWQWPRRCCAGWPRAQTRWRPRRRRSR